MQDEEAIHQEAGKEAMENTIAIAIEQGATREKALRVISKAMDVGVRRKKPDLLVALRGADMALKIHDAYPSEKREVTLKGGLSVTHLSDEELDNALTELDEIESDE